MFKWCFWILGGEEDGAKNIINTAVSDTLGLRDGAYRNFAISFNMQNRRRSTEKAYNSNARTREI